MQALGWLIEPKVLDGVRLRSSWERAPARECIIRICSLKLLVGASPCSRMLAKTQRNIQALMPDSPFGRRGDLPQESLFGRRGDLPQERLFGSRGSLSQQSLFGRWATLHKIWPPASG
jgi:hypothetical protein